MIGYSQWKSKGFNNFSLISILSLNKPNGNQFSKLEFALGVQGTMTQMLRNQVQKRKRGFKIPGRSTGSKA